MTTESICVNCLEKQNQELLKLREFVVSINKHREVRDANGLTIQCATLRDIECKAKSLSPAEDKKCPFATLEQINRRNKYCQ